MNWGLLKFLYFGGWRVFGWFLNLIPEDENGWVFQDVCWVGEMAAVAPASAGCRGSSYG